MLANEVERLKPPQYVAFRTMETWVVIPAIARIESREGGRLYGCWFRRFTPEGTFREVSVDHVVDLGADRDAETLIDLIRDGRELPVESVQRLHVIDWRGPAATTPREPIFRQGRELVERLPIVE